MKPPNSMRAVMKHVQRMSVEGALYAEAMRESFERRYREQRDSWTGDTAATLAGQELLSRLLPDRQHTVLDIGAGRGRDLELFLRAGHRGSGIDIIAPDNWPAMRAQWGDAVELMQTSLLDWASTQRFSAVLDNGCFHHQHPEDIPAYLRGVRERLAPGGVALFSVYTPTRSTDGGALLLDGDGRLHREFSPAEMRGHLALAGLAVVEARRVQRAWGGKLLFVVCVRMDDVTPASD